MASERLMPDTPVVLTDQGRAAVAVGGMKRLFPKARIRAMRRNQHRFCAMPRPSVSPLTWNEQAFTGQTHETDSSAHTLPLFLIEDGEDGRYTVTFSYDKYTEEDMPIEAVTLMCDRDTLDRMLADLLDTAILLTESNQIRKVALFGAGQAYILTFAKVADESGEYGATLRTTMAPILFNRQRFIGKRDSELDYAQCGSNVMTRTDMCTNIFAAATIYDSAMLRPDLLGESAGHRMDALYKKLQP